MSPSHRAAALAFAVVALVAGARAAAAERVTSYAFVRSVDTGKAASGFEHSDHKCYVYAKVPAHPLAYEPTPYDMTLLIGARIVHAVVNTDHCYDGARTWQPVEYDPTNPSELDFDWSTPHNIITVLWGCMLAVVVAVAIVGNRVRRYRVRHPKRAMPRRHAGRG